MRYIRNSDNNREMSRHSARKVKLTSKFEEFSTSKLSKVVSPKVEPGLRKAAALANIASAVPSIPISSAPHTAPSTPAPPPVPIPAPPAVVASTPLTRISSKPATPITPIPDHRLSVNYLPKLTANGKIRGRPRKCFIPKAETVVKPISSTREEILRLREENLNLRQQLEQAQAEYDDLKRQSSYTGQTVPKVDYEDLKEKYQRDIAHAKRHEWCAVCFAPSRYHCCWNTTYCSQKCQVGDWYTRHMKSCERRKALKTVS